MATRRRRKKRHHTNLFRVFAVFLVAGLIGTPLVKASYPHHSVPRVNGHGQDLLWLPGTLRAAGITVIEEPGWRTRGHDAPFTPRAVILHHDGSPAGPTPWMAGWLIGGFASDSDEHYDAQVWVDYAGRWHMIAAGAAQHAGTGRGFGRIPADQGNQYSFGVETDHTMGEPWPPAQLASIERGFAAICQARHWDPDVSVAGHKDYAKGRKPDPDGIDMNQFRGELDRDLGLAA